jgi:hypothetical protein
VKGFTLLAFDIPAGQAAAYYPEVNPLVPLESTGRWQPYADVEVHCDPVGSGDVETARII